eukprot:3094841-Amphidinium_carterae.2
MALASDEMVPVSHVPAMPWRAPASPSGSLEPSDFPLHVAASLRLLYDRTGLDEVLVVRSSRVRDGKNHSR